MNERRLFCRWKINSLTDVRIGEAQARTSCLLKDISYKGMRICLDSSLSKDTFLKFCVFLSEECCLNDVEAWVVWHKIIGGVNVYGLYFNRIYDSNKEKIYQFVCRNFREQVCKRWWQGLTEEKGGEEMEDRRIFYRFAARFLLKYLESTSGREGQAQTEDISAKGLGLATNEELAPKTSLEMWIQIPDKGEPLYTRGEVVWSKMVEPNKYRVGVNLDKADLIGLSRALRVT